MWRQRRNTRMFVKSLHEQNSSKAYTKTSSLPGKVAQLLFATLGQTQVSKSTGETAPFSSQRCPAQTYGFPRLGDSGGSLRKGVGGWASGPRDHPKSFVLARKPPERGQMGVAQNEEKKKQGKTAGSLWFHLPRCDFGTVF